MTELKGKKVLIFQQRSWGRVIGRPLAKKLYQNGARVAAFTSTRATDSLIKTQTDVKYDLIINYDEILDNPSKFLGGDDFSLKEICEDLGIDSVWPLLMPQRFLVLSYRDKYYYAFRQNVSDKVIVDYVKAVYKAAKTFFDKFNPDVIVASNFSSTYHIIFSLYAQKHGATMLAFTQSKVEGISFCIYDHNESMGPFYERVDALNSGSAQSKNIARARKYVQEFEQQFKKLDPTNYFPKKTLKKKIREKIRPYRQILNWYRKGSQECLEAVGPTTDCRSPKFILRDHYCKKRYQRFMDNFDYFPFARVGKFVYFPLQVQPEEMIDVRAPFFNNQIETARLIAISLPNDYTLVVKEHPGMAGIRPGSYLEKVARTPNVKLVDYRIPNEQIIKRADLIVSPNSTTTAEAAFLKVPTIQLGNLGTTLKLPNVFKHTDMSTLAKKIKQVLAADLNTPEYQRRLENYVAATYDVGVNLNYVAMWQKDTNDAFCNAYLEAIIRAINKNKPYD